VNEVVWELVVTALDTKSIWTVFGVPVIASRFVIDFLAAIKIDSYEG
jgi:hypothetical protein